MSENNKGLRGTEAEAKTRLLLALWDMEGLTQDVKRGDLLKRLVRTNETAKDYQPIFEALEQDEAIALQTKNRASQVKLTGKGLGLLLADLNSPEFAFPGNQVGTRIPNALLKWIRGLGGGTPAGSEVPEVPEVPVETAPSTATGEITSLEEFKPVALALSEKLDKEYNYLNLIPIYALRREMGDKVTRSQFNDWLIELQAGDIIELTAGEMPDSTPDKREDSLILPGGEFRYYLKILKS